MDEQPKAYWYRCSNCGTVMHAPVKATYGQPYRCIGSGQNCWGYMKYLYYDTIRPEQAGRVVYNPGLQEKTSRGE